MQNKFLIQLPALKAPKFLTSETTDSAQIILAGQNGTNQFG